MVDFTLPEPIRVLVTDRMRGMLGHMTHNRFVAVGIGALVTTIIQSSSATSVMLVGFVNSRLMDFRRTIGIILGAMIGTTFTAQIIAFKITDYALLIIAVGFFIYAFSSKPRIKHLGETADYLATEIQNYLTALTRENVGQKR